MEKNSQYSQKNKLESQIREAYGKVTYSFTSHNKMVDRLITYNNRIKIMQIVLSAITTGSFLITILNNEKIAGVIGAIASVILLILNAYVKDFDLSKISQEHQSAANDLWIIREEYVSLLTDFETLNIAEITKKRDNLQQKTMQVYSQSPKTDKRSYKEAQKALKVQEEQTFTDKEIDVMLPNDIRRTKL
ncbi:SLATT domain-containing protein [Macrococcoides caseolyticum]|uniref:Uncharacterized protein n=1 Tax=Macrococcoides caseolyticum TaxID=69966 RepID=A0ACC9MQ16_9STAP|nr:SLATT domain-containing protein [Macrococcus caseolyticus]PKE38405.1 hypothetical protein CW675_11230 [Macrococcus caseolyticus]PKE55550.1 hypothetical protein CW682_11455 [Macrococcus caseolyticus]PKF39951.1 hypothetical protein CW661_10820 [Macrococcus caseolyticus]QYA36607.1 SLATT domain-containing protein [Macrococcus caseolyticus]